MAAQTMAVIPMEAHVQISSVIPQLRTTDLASSVAFYTTKLGFTLEFQYQDFYAGVRSGPYMIHLKLVDTPDPSIAYVAREDHMTEGVRHR